MSGTIPYCTPLSRTVPLSDGPFVTGVLKNSTDTVYLKPEQCSGEGCYLKKGQCVFQIPNHEVTSKTSRGVIGVGSNYPLRPADRPPIEVLTNQRFMLCESAPPNFNSNFSNLAWLHQSEIPNLSNKSKCLFCDDV